MSGPFRLVHEYMTVRPPGGQLFLIHKDTQPLSASLQKVLKRAVRANGWDPNQLGSHSFRIGAATKAAIRCESIEDKREREKSKVYKKYTRPINGTGNGS
ncbi:hypothetical protein XELAEV_18026866mg [Xenopus laevis]|uniref:Tyr recombinase domain-containing protein n=1 Tax=Xenopus laevis TaxID=8355 RepID=A0A974CV67_XENLA|nr:hypothetical protein XELAEV_18026866mg [Xenopus laevis]